MLEAIADLTHAHSQGENHLMNLRSMRFTRVYSRETGQTDSQG